MALRNHFRKEKKW